MSRRLKTFCTERDVRAGSCTLPLLSVSIHKGVVPRSSVTDDLSRAEDLSNYKICERRDLVLNRMRAFQGAVGLAPMRGLVSPDYSVISVDTSAIPEYVSYLVRSAKFVAMMIERIRGIGSTELGSVRTPRINVEDLMDLSVELPGLAEQRRIADFLDDQVARIDSIIAVRGAQRALIDQSKLDLASATLIGTDGVHVSRRPVGISWLEDIPVDWMMTTVHSAYSVLLGKMLDEKQQSGRFPTPYLRNTNVQWDRITIDDIKVMDIEPSELERFTVRLGDLLICEGGQPGRSAVWNGEIVPMGFQKALHRARPRGSNDVRWLQTFLRVAVGLNVFSTEFGQATIGHLTGEQLRSLRLPLPDPAIQGSLSDKLDRDLAELRGVDRSLLRSIALLGELKSSLITAAVTGDFDVSAADGSQILAGVSS